MTSPATNIAELLNGLCDAGVIADIDRCFAQLMAEMDSDSIALPAALLSALHRAGHTSLPIDHCASRRFADCVEALPPTAAKAMAQMPETVRECRLPSRADLEATLTASAVVSDATAEASQARPLVFDRGHLYLQRLFVAEEGLARRLQELAERTEPVDGATAALERLFPDEQNAESRDAARTAIERRLCVVSGGPGTGKTTLVARLIELFLALDLAKPSRIGLATPTGKAAARLQESIASQTSSPALAPFAAENEAITIHRLLRQKNRLALLDVLFVDECSMIDLEMMARLVSALPAHTRLVLLGDAAQLGSVRPGAVFRDLCASAGTDKNSPLAPAVTALTTSFRFRPDGGIGRLAAAVLAGDAERATTALNDPEDSALTWQSMPGTAAFERYASRYADEWCAPLIAAWRDGEQGVAPFPKRRVLCAHRRGPFGASRLNRLVEQRLRDSGLIADDDEFYIGRPIIVTRNDPETGLSNGDTGVVIAESANETEGGENNRSTRQVWFPDLRTRTGEKRLVSPLRLPAHESLFALTVHRAQGSEYDEVAFVPGPAESRVSNRELFYTAVTRAREKVLVLAERDSLRASIERRAERRSALLERLATRRLE